MSNVKRYELHFAADSMLKVDDAGRFVLASDYDALAQRCAELEAGRDTGRAVVRELQAERDALRAKVDRLKAESEDLAAHLADAEHRAENAGRNASAFENSMGDLQVENGKLRAEVKRLSQALRRIHARAEAYTSEERGISEDSTLVIEGIARKALEGSECADTTGKPPAA